MSEPRPPLKVVRGGRPDAPRGSARPERPVSADDLRAARELTAAGTGLVLTLALMARLDSWARSLGTFQSLFAVAFLFFAVALVRARGRAIPRAGLIVFGVALAARVALLPVTPTLSDDVYRYVWEGRVAGHGGDPWRASPSDPSLAHLRDRVIHPRINHPELATIYPPLAIAGFALVAAISPTVLAVKAWVVANDLALVLLLLAWTRRRGLGAVAAIAYAWNPLVVVEYAGSGHYDPAGIVWLVAALLLAERRPMLSALAVAIGTLTRVVPLIALPFLWRGWPWRARALALAACGGGLGWFWLRTRGADSGLDAYLRSWSNNELAFALLARLTGDPVARLVVAVLLVGLVAALAWRGGNPASSTRAALRAGFLLSPVAHPWYLGWAIAFEPFGWSAPWLLLSLTAVLSYGVLAPPAEGSAFHLPLAWRWVEYGLPLLLAAAIAVTRLRRRGTVAAR